jgi:hypothetical protein
MSRSWVVSFSLMSLSSLITASAWCTLWSVVEVLECLGHCLSSSVLPFIDKITTYPHLCLWLHVPSTPPPAGNEFSLMWHHSYEEMKSHSVLWHLTRFPIDKKALNWLYSNTVWLWCPVMAVWQHRPSRIVCYMVKSAVRWLLNVRQAVALFSTIPLYVHTVCMMS